MTPRVHVEGPLGEGMALELPPAAGHHARVLRLREGDELTVFDGSGGEWKALVIGKAKVRLQQFREIERESPLAITLVQGVSSGERMDYTVQKAVELGVAAIQPLLTKKGVVKLQGSRAPARVAHWQKVVIAACEQCGRNRIPQVASLLDFGDYIREVKSGKPMLLLSAQGRPLKELDIRGEAVIAAGPEAGFAAEEQAALERAGFAKASLGPRILRTETAALAALAALNVLRGDF
ncbi:MAG TPA: 16S rRNA (uracil(1498)-N(3))-methyltransferase [Burkholderiales bacterium]|jgi:16S rRNA (uracil1498-N3)-methyltransferase